MRPVLRLLCGLRAICVPVRSFTNQLSPRTWLGLFGRNALAADAGVSPVGSGFESFALAHNVATEPEVDEVINQALDAGATLVKAPRRAEWGGYSGYFKDLDGHLWEVAHNPFMWIGPRDSVD